MRYKKCECGEIIAFDENKKIPMKCNCGRKLNSQTYSDEDLQLINNGHEEKKYKTKFYFEEINFGWQCDIPDNAADYILGRGCGSFNEKFCGNNISRKHITISNKNDCLLLVDYSLNGTRVNGKKIQKNQNVKIYTGDIVTLDAIKNSISIKLMKREE